MDDRSTAEGAALLDVITEAEDRLLTLAGLAPVSPTMCADGNRGGAPVARWRALDIARREVRAAVEQLAGRAA